MLGLWQATAFVTGPVRWALAANFGIFLKETWGPGGYLGGKGLPAHGKPSCKMNSERFVILLSPQGVDHGT